MSDGTGSEMPPPEIDELLGAYVLDAVDPDERELVEQHLAADPVARAEVDEMRETAAVLATLPVGDEGAPAGLWDRIAGAIGVSGDRHDDGDAHKVVPLERPKRSASIPARYAVPIAAVAALIIAVLAIQVATSSPSKVGDTAAAFDHAVANGATTVQLTAGADSNDVAAEIALQSDGSGFLRNAKLAALPSGKTYQLWALVSRGKATRAISAGVLGAEPDVVAFHVADAPKAFAVTVETAPGVVRSRNDPVAAGSLEVTTAS